VFLKDVLQDVGLPAAKTARHQAPRKPASRAVAKKAGTAKATSSRTRRAG
jgi:hypothetical protein